MGERSGSGLRSRPDSAWDPSPPKWVRGRPAGPVRGVGRQVVAELEADRAQARAARRVLAYRKLDAINEAWERRGRPAR